MNNPRHIFYSLALTATMLLTAGCGRHAVPRPYGYVRISLPDTCYTAYRSDRMPVGFDLSCNARTVYRDTVEGWLDLVYPRLHARIYCSYQPVRGNFARLADDAYSFVYKHAVMADAIPEQGYEDPARQIYGVFYELYGNTASPLQFVLTDSTRHFFRAALYFNCTPNQDSLQPVIDYMRQDMVRMVETFSWQ